MVKVTFVSHDGENFNVSGSEGDTLLDVARAGDIPGITGECGGCLSCATCHVYIDEPWLALLSDVSEEEDAMLDGTYSDRESSSRLGCQVKLTAGLDGLVVRLPERQT